MLNSIKNGDKIWQILSEDERVAITLQLIEGKSTWQAGEIMGKSHYKYLEIFSRAREFIKTLQPFFMRYDTICPRSLALSKPLKDYFRILLTKRTKLQEASKKALSETPLRRSGKRDAQIIREFKKLKDSPYEVDQLWLSVILHFDKWNNHRILPKAIQEPHAFKRRNKARYVAHIVSLKTLPLYALDRLLIYLDRDSEKPIYYAHILYPNKKNLLVPKPISFSNKKSLVELIDGLGIYYFSSQEESEAYIAHILEYGLGPTTPAMGLKYWSRYRAIIKTSKNYFEQQNIIPSRAYLDQLLSSAKDLEESLNLRAELNPKKKFRKFERNQK